MREIKIFTSDEHELSDIKLNDYGKRSKFGGNPTWIQNDETPKCPSCKDRMDFIAQIDSIDYTGSAITSGEYMFGDVGIIYLFFCFNCGVSKSVFQE